MFFHDDGLSEYAGLSDVAFVWFWETKYRLFIGISDKHI